MSCECFSILWADESIDKGELLLIDYLIYGGESPKKN